MNPEKIRKVYAPYSTTGEQVGQTPLTGYVDVAQAIYPAVNTGQVSTDGEWSGVIVSDKTFRIDTTHEGVPNAAAVLVPQKANADFIDMTGYNDLLIAIRPTRGGNLATTAVMGPDTNTFANLTPVDAASVLRGASLPQNSTADLQPLFEDAAQDAPVDVWSIYILQGVVAGQKNLQFKITNNSGGNSPPLY